MLLKIERSLYLKRMNKLWKYITRSWSDEQYKGKYVHGRAKMFPPIVYDFPGFLMFLGIIAVAVTKVGEWFGLL